MKKRVIMDNHYTTLHSILYVVGGYRERKQKQKITLIQWTNNKQNYCNKYVGNSYTMQDQWIVKYEMHTTPLQHPHTMAQYHTRNSKSFDKFLNYCVENVCEHNKE